MFPADHTACLPSPVRARLGSARGNTRLRRGRTSPRQGSAPGRRQRPGRRPVGRRREEKRALAARRGGPADGQAAPTALDEVLFGQPALSLATQMQCRAVRHGSRRTNEHLIVRRREVRLESETSSRPGSRTTDMSLCIVRGPYGPVL